MYLSLRPKRALERESYRVVLHKTRGKIADTCCSTLNFFSSGHCRSMVVSSLGCDHPSSNNTPIAVFFFIPLRRPISKYSRWAQQDFISGAYIRIKSPDTLVYRVPLLMIHFRHGCRKSVGRPWNLHVNYGTCLTDRVKVGALRLRSKL